MLVFLFVGGFWDFFVIVGTGFFNMYELESEVVSSFTVYVYRLRYP